MATAILPVPAGNRRLLLSELLPGPENDVARKAIVSKGKFSPKGSKVDLMVGTRPLGDDYEVTVIAAVSRTPGRSDDYLSTVPDYVDVTKDRATQVRQYWAIYQNEGLVNNAINKLSALLSTGGSFKVRGGRRGKTRAPVDDLLALLRWWADNVNQAATDTVLMGSRGLKAVTHQGVRQALVEGSWMARQNWQSIQAGVIGKFDLPINIQTVSTQYIVPVVELVGTGADMYYWQPPRSLVNRLIAPTDKSVAPIVKRLFPTKQLQILQRDGKLLLDSSLLLHVKHRAMDSVAFGESVIQSALTGVAFRRQIDALDMVSMESLINRLTVVMVGSDNPESPYFPADVAMQRMKLMQSFFEDPGPNMTVIWAGPDVKVEDVGAHSSVLQLDNRHKLADGRIKDAIGVPEALLSGTTSDGKAAGWAASLGTAAELEELQNAFAVLWGSVGERIALENGWQDVDLVYEFDHALLGDRVEEMNQNRLDYVAGGISIHTFLRSRGLDPDAEYRHRCEEQGLDPDSDIPYVQVFTPPQGLQGQGGPGGTAPGDGTPPAAPAPAPPPGQGPGKTPGGGRPTNRQQGKPSQPAPERKTTRQRK